MKAKLIKYETEYVEFIMTHNIKTTNDVKDEETAQQLIDILKKIKKEHRKLARIDSSYFDSEVSRKIKVIDRMLEQYKLSIKYYRFM